MILWILTIIACIKLDWGNVTYLQGFKDRTLNPAYIVSCVVHLLITHQVIDPWCLNVIVMYYFVFCCRLNLCYRNASPLMKPKPPIILPLLLNPLFPLFLSNLPTHLLLSNLLNHLYPSNQKHHLVLACQTM